MADLDIEVSRLGARGDGIADSPDGPLYVAYSLPGERLRVKPGAKRGEGRVATLVEILKAAPERADPPCPHFGECGGCALQHMSGPAELAWKRTLVAEALARRGLEAVPVNETCAIPLGARRRTTLHAVRAGGRVVLGFNARASHRLIPVTACAVLDPRLSNLIGPLRVLAGHLPMPKRGLEISLTATAGGIDLLIGAPGSPELEVRERLTAFALDHDLARVSWGRRDPELIMLSHSPHVSLGGVTVVVPAGGFLQAGANAEAILIERVGAHIGQSRKVADLYAGVGTFALSLAAEGIQVDAFDGDGAAIASLQAAVNAAAGRRQVTPTVRDLAERPLSADELADFDAAVLDPPRAGAAAQAEELSRSGVAKIAYVSCHPGTFARDARILVDGGYALIDVTPVNQFQWSPHVELIGRFVNNY